MEIDGLDKRLIYEGYSHLFGIKDACRRKGELKQVGRRKEATASSAILNVLLIGFFSWFLFADIQREWFKGFASQIPGVAAAKSESFILTIISKLISTMLMFEGCVFLLFGDRPGKWTWVFAIISVVMAIPYFSGYTCWYEDGRLIEYGAFGKVNSEYSLDDIECLEISANDQVISGKTVTQGYIGMKPTYASSESKTTHGFSLDSFLAATPYERLERMIRMKEKIPSDLIVQDIPSRSALETAFHGEELPEAAWPRINQLFDMIENEVSQ